MTYDKRFKVSYLIHRASDGKPMRRTKTVRARHSGRAMDIVEQSIKGARAISAAAY